MQFQSHRRWATLLIVAMVATACSSGDDDLSMIVRTTTDLSDTADPSGDDTDGAAQPGATTAPVECTSELVEDEYGFIQEIQICDGEVVTAAELPLEDSLADLAAVAGSQAGTVLAAGVRDRLILQTGCAAPTTTFDAAELANPAAVGDAIRLVPDVAAQQLLIDAFAALTEADAACNVDPGAWRAATRRALAALDEFAIAVGADPADRDIAAAAPGEADDLSLLSSAAANLYDRLYQVLTGSRPLQGSDLWFSSSHFAHVRGLLGLVSDEQPPDAVILGSSLVARGVEPQTITDATGRDYVSLGLTGATQPVHLALADEALRLAPGIDTIVWSQSTHSFFRACVTGDAERIDAPLRLQQQAFGAVAGLDTVDPPARLLGAAPSESGYATSPIAQSAQQLHGDWSRGATKAWEGRNEQRIAEQRGPFETVYTQPVVCDELFDLVSGTVERWTAAGIDVVLFVPPSSDDTTAIHPDGRAGHDVIVERLRQLAAATGAGFTDLSDIVDDADFYDMTHVNAEGRAVFSAGLGDFLAGR